MSAQRIYFKAKAIGYYRSEAARQTGPFYLHEIEVCQLDLIEIEEVEAFDFNELKTGVFHNPKRKIINVRVFLESGKFIREDIRDILFRCMERTDRLTVEGNEWQGFTAETYFTIERKIAVRPTLIPTISKRTIWPFSRTGTGTKTPPTTYDPNPGGSTGTVVEPEPTTPASPLLGLVILFLCSGFIIGLFFGFSGGSLLFLILLGISFLISFLSDRFQVFHRIFGVNFTLWNIIGWIFIFFSLLSFGTYGPDNGNISGFLLGLAIILWSRNAVWLKRLGQLSFFVVLLMFLANSGIFDGFDDDRVKIKKKKYSDDREFVEEEHIKFKKEKDTVVNDQGDKIIQEKLSHSLQWKDNFQRRHSAIISVYKKDYESAAIKRNRSEVNESTSLRYWNKVYAQTIYDNREYLNQVIATFSSIGKSKQLNRKEFADMVVSGIQNIPYYLVHDLSHEEADRQYGGFIREWHNKGGNCLDKMKFGIQSPAEFMGNFKGDCDTRSVLLFYILSKFNYQVAVFVSEQYGHAILGIAGDYSGKFKEYRGIRYFAWETTAVQFVPGVLPPDFGNMYYWQIALTNN